MRSKVEKAKPASFVPPSWTRVINTHSPECLEMMPTS